MSSDFFENYCIPTAIDYPFSYAQFSFVTVMNQNAFAIYLAAKILNKSTTKFKRTYLLNRYFYQLAGTDMDMEVVKWGDKLLLISRLCMFNQQANESKRFKLYELAQEMFFESIYENGHFPEKFFEEEKINLLKEIEIYKDNQIDLHFQFFLEKMFSKDPFRYSLLGEEEQVKKCTNSEISNLYRKFTDQSERIPILYGPFSEKEILFFEDFTRIRTGSNLSEKKPIKPKKPLTVEEEISYQQSWIFMGYRHDIHRNHVLYPALHLYNQILGKLPASVLYSRLREDLGLCYSVGSSLPFGKDVLFIIAGLLYEDKEAFIHEIENIIHSFSSIKDKNRYVELAKNRILTNVQSWLDYPYSRLNFELEIKVIQAKYSFQSYIQSIEKVRWKDIEEVGSHIWLDTLYVCKGKNKT